MAKTADHLDAEPLASDLEDGAPRREDPDAPEEEKEEEDWNEVKKTCWSCSGYECTVCEARRRMEEEEEEETLTLSVEVKVTPTW